MRQNNRDVGFVSEAAFIYAAMKRGIQISRPMFDSAHFDLIATNSNIHRIQIKSTNTIIGDNTYRIATNYGANSRKRYTENEIEIIACHLIPIDTWYIVPVSKIITQTIRLYPNKLDNRFNKYKERWNLIT